MKHCAKMSQWANEMSAFSSQEATMISSSILNDFRRINTWWSILLWRRFKRSLMSLLFTPKQNFKNKLYELFSQMKIKMKFNFIITLKDISHKAINSLFWFFFFFLFAQDIPKKIFLGKSTYLVEKWS